MFNVGHDVGGFAGPVPEPELLVRWVQTGVLHPRFLFNSWKVFPDSFEPLSASCFLFPLPFFFRVVLMAALCKDQWSWTGNHWC